MVHGVQICSKRGVVFYTSRSERKIFGRALKTQHNSFAVVVLEKKNFLLGKRSPAAWRCNPCEGGMLVQDQNVDAWVSCWILWLWSEQCTTGFRIAPAFAAASFGGFSVVRLQLDPNNLPSFHPCGCLPACAYGNLRLLPIHLHNLRIALPVPFGSGASRFDNLGFLD